ncbi:MAG TPA: polyphosphate:AMP phosphotransferase [Rhodospirillaceae bacterium]|nr:MAG: polyphosphate:AMP phosphotransferase [Alphaproteobacteria bacterium GWF2_58_20]HAU29385.1 polyphosphate:AMP phosphotransferase [Rhodospirillaceae bacterium]
MFENAELGHNISKEDYKARLPALRQALLDAQSELAEKHGFPVIILVSGMDGAGKGDTVNILNEWMDPRLLRTIAMEEAPTEEEREHPAMWRVWKALPPKGRVGIFIGSWYSPAALRYIHGESSDADLASEMEDILRFEKMLADEGALVLKFWLHLSKKQQKHRFEKLSKHKETSWRVTETDWHRHKSYDQIKAVAETTIGMTNTAHAPWIIVDGSDKHYRDITIAETILDALKTRLATPVPAPSAPAILTPRPHQDINVLSAMDLSKSISQDTYREDLEKWQGRLNLLSRDPDFAKHAVVAVFEGQDAAGKGGSIRRITQALDARSYHVISISAPSEEERAQPYLWRFWHQLPRHGKFTIFDRSWYGRVLVERVEGFCRESDWMRAYSEINDFEAELTRSGVILVKFWLQIDQQTQLERFKEREATGFKRFKLTPEDWRNREKWDSYAGAICDMVERTSTSHAPWTMVEANDKHYARIKVLETLCHAIKSRLD